MARLGLLGSMDSGTMPRKRNLFRAKEDSLLRELVAAFGVDDWEIVAGSMPGRTCRQCRERWFNYLSPSVKSGPWTNEEVSLLISKVNELGLRWKSLEVYFPGRTDINIRNRYRQLQKSLGVSRETILPVRAFTPAAEIEPPPVESHAPRRAPHLPGFDDIIAALVRESENDNPEETMNPFAPHVLF
jgi:hypothetical protein